MDAFSQNQQVPGFIDGQIEGGPVTDLVSRIHDPGYAIAFVGDGAVGALGHHHHILIHRHLQEVSQAFSQNSFLGIRR